MTGLLMREFRKKKKSSSLAKALSKQATFSKDLDGMKSKKKENPTRSNEFQNEKCQPKLAGIFGVTSQPFPPIELQLALFQSE